MTSTHRLANSRRRARFRGRCGFTLVETAVSTILLAAVLLTAVPTLGWIVRTRQSAQQHEAAILAIGNLMERITSLDWNDLTSERVAAMQLPEEVQRQLPGAELRVDLSPAADEPDARKVTLEIRWPESIHGNWSAPVRLAAWVYPPSRSEP